VTIEISNGKENLLSGALYGTSKRILESRWQRIWENTAGHMKQETDA